ncbi:hypothetical protein HMPREF1986_01538 [Oribacterium sp. oral taxon 078 str. F0263]|nr:hypothetical protein HMPREF1986_01538 [Oribacterium sp. oral taxon 078 str. F0263]
MNIIWEIQDYCNKNIVIRKRKGKRDIDILVKQKYILDSSEER